MRYLEPYVGEFLEKKMVFIGGPRQVGKTTLGLQFLKTQTEKDPGYLNWDRSRDRELLLKQILPGAVQTLLIDEIHKYKRWKNLMKGLYDTEKSERKFLVTGSARMDTYQKGGDSLLGRYRYLRLHPFSWPELREQGHKNVSLDQLIELGGFPEPLFSGSAREHRLWQRERKVKIIREDLRDLERVVEISLVELLLNALPERVGSPLSVQGLREDLVVAHDSVKRWLEILERLYLVFRISPYGSPRIRAVKKEQKLYFWDWSDLTEKGPRFENFVASHLLKYCHFIEDTEGHEMELRFIRDTDQREVDFIVLKDKKPHFSVECKTGEKAVSKFALYFKERLPAHRMYQVHLGQKDYGNEKSGVRVLPFTTFCTEVGLV